MRKIMLVIDDFNELEFLESLLRRLGFDVLSLSKDVSVPSAILGFFPDLVVAQAKSRAVDGIVLSQKVRKLASQARMVLLHPIGQPPKVGIELKQSVDAFLEMPVDTSKLIAMLAQLGSLDENVLKEKLNRFASTKMSDEKRNRLQGIASPSNIPLSNATMVGGGSGVKAKQSDVVHVTSKSANSTTESSITQSGQRASGGANIVTGGGGSNTAQGIAPTSAAAVNATGDAFNKGVHHFQGTNTLKGAAHIAGERKAEGAAYDPTGAQSTEGRAGAAYVPSGSGDESGVGSASRKALLENAEVTERTKRYDQFLASHDEPADRVLPQGEMKREAKRLKLDVPTPENDLEDKREFVRALFRKK